MRGGWGRRLAHSTRKPPGRDCLLPASSVRRPAQAGFVLIIFDAPIRRQGHHPQIGKRPRRGRAHHATQNRSHTRLARTTDARTDQGPLPTSPTDGYRVLGYVAHFRAVAATCLSGAQANLRPSPTPPTDHHRPLGPRRSPSGHDNNLPLRRSDKPRACAKLTHKRFSGTRSSHLSAPSIFDGPWLAAAMAILPALATLPATGEARTYLGPSPVCPADGLRAYCPQLSIVGAPQITAARRCHCRRSRRI